MRPALPIQGDPGAGKSAVLAELINENPQGAVLAWHCCQWDNVETLEPWRFVVSLAARLAEGIPEYHEKLRDPAIRELFDEPRCRDNPGHALEHGLLNPLQNSPPPDDGARLILIDALDEALLVPQGLTISDLFASRLNRFPAWLRIVATTRREPAVLDKLRSLRAEAIDAQSRENLEDIHRYLETRLAQPEFTAPLSEVQRTAADMARLLLDKSCGNFLYVRQALDDLATGIYSADQLAHLPPGLSSLYELQFERHFPTAESFATARRLFDVLVAAAEPLPERLLAAATGLDSDDELPRLLRRLAAYVPKAPSRLGRSWARSSRRSRMLALVYS